MSNSSVKLKVGDKVYCTKGGLKEVTVTKLSSTYVVWADKDGFKYEDSFGGSTGCLLRALFIGEDVFLTKEEAKKSLRLTLIRRLNRLLKELQEIDEL